MLIYITTHMWLKLALISNKLQLQIGDQWLHENPSPKSVFGLKKSFQTIGLNRSSDTSNVYIKFWIEIPKQTEVMHLNPCQMETGKVDPVYPATSFIRQGYTDDPVFRCICGSLGPYEITKMNRML